MVGETAYICDHPLRTPARARWTAHIITDETSQSWLVEDRGQMRRVNKRTLLVSERGVVRSCIIGAAAFERRMWVEENYHRIVRAVERCDDYDALRAIDALLRKGENDDH